ncbi:hypothetical protein [Nonomuraea sp. NPDC050310]|uniref:hypothetical protein n=1 Tax=unclassified Nonomuraea TaxID=2593643 RepID=UPI0033D258D8
MRHLPALLAIAALVACQAAPEPRTDKYSTGGDAKDSPCTRVISSIGYAELLLLPRGQEDRQNFEDAVLGRIAETRGIAAEFGGRLPESIKAAAGELEQAASGLARADVPRERQVELLKRYRAATEEIKKNCRT